MLSSIVDAVTQELICLHMSRNSYNYVKPLILMISGKFSIWEFVFCTIYKEVRQKGCCIYLKWLWTRYKLFFFTEELRVFVLDDLIIVFGFLDQ